MKKAVITLVLTLLEAASLWGQEAHKFRLHLGSEFSGYRIASNLTGNQSLERVRNFMPRLGVQREKFYAGGFYHFGSQVSTSRNLRSRVNGWGLLFRYYLNNFHPDDSAHVLWKTERLRYIPVFLEYNYWNTNFDSRDRLFVEDGRRRQTGSFRLGTHLRLYRQFFLTVGYVIVLHSTLTQPPGRIGAFLSCDYVFSL